MADKTAQLRLLAGELRTNQALLGDLEDRTREVRSRINMITREELVDLMNELDVTRFDLAAEGNLPPLKFEMGQHYSGSIPRDWEDERREAAFAALPDELVKITVRAVFAKGEAPQARALADDLFTAGYTVVLEKEVHHSTLKAWLRETFEGGGSLPNLETIGSSIFQEVKVKEV